MLSWKKKFCSELSDWRPNIQNFKLVYDCRCYNGLIYLVERANIKKKRINIEN